MIGRARRTGLLPACLAAGSLLFAQADAGPARPAARARIEKNLRENVIRFSFPRSVDAVHGGATAVR
ncbi:MAG TPA: hypothetical protein VD833_04460 [Vicinamibacterales bacterium]|nr:hypothetical protein [Vicinamibacterales bacterium]